MYELKGPRKNVDVNIYIFTYENHEVNKDRILGSCWRLSLSFDNIQKGEITY